MESFKNVSDHLDVKSPHLTYFKITFIASFHLQLSNLDIFSAHAQSFLNTVIVKKLTEKLFFVIWFWTIFQRNKKLINITTDNVIFVNK